MSPHRFIQYLIAVSFVMLPARPPTEAGDKEHDPLAGIGIPPDLLQGLLEQLPGDVPLPVAVRLTDADGRAVAGHEVTLRWDGGTQKTGPVSLSATGLDQS